MAPHPQAHIPTAGVSNPDRAQPPGRPQGCNPLVGPNDGIGLRFPSMVNAYDPRLRGILTNCAREAGIRLPEGVYVAVMGPSFETPAEIRAFERLGADVVGMSTVSEVIAARHSPH